MMVTMMVMLKPLLVLAALTTAAPASSASAGSARVVLVELFTSQGCSACPAADELVRQLPGLGYGRDRVVPLTFHVDYWDDLGWKDRFSTPALTARQRRYAGGHALSSPAGEEGLSGIYTPQMIVDGRVHFSGSRRDVALAEIARAATRPPEARLTAHAQRTPSGVVVTGQVMPTAQAIAQPPAGTPPPARAPARAADSWEVVVALCAREARTQVSRGENAGQTLTEAAVVRALSPPIALALPARSPSDHDGAAGAAAFQVTLASPADLAWGDVEIVAFVQSRRTLQILAAASVPLAVR